MKVRLSVVLVSIFGMLSVTGCHRETAGPETTASPGAAVAEPAALTEAEARTLGHDAYLYAFPIVENYLSIEAGAHVRQEVPEGIAQGKTRNPHLDLRAPESERPLGVGSVHRPIDCQRRSPEQSGSVPVIRVNGARRGQSCCPGHIVAAFSP